MARTYDARQLITIAVLAVTTFTHALAHNTRDSDVPILVGCFSTSEPLSNQGTYKYQSSGYCSGICTSRNQGVVGLSNGNVCWCGDFLPPESAKVLDSRCDTPCQGYGLEDCGGGTYYFTVWLTGLMSNVPNYKPNSNASTTASSKTTATPSTPTTMSTTTNNTPPSTPKPTSLPTSSKSGQPSDKKLAIILASVFGIVAFAVMAVLFCCLWRRRKRTGSFRRNRSPDLLTSLTRPDSTASSVPEATIFVSAGSRTWEGRISRTPATPRHSQPAMAFNPVAGERERDARSTSEEDNPFYTPQEASSTYSNHTDPDGQELHSGADVEPSSSVPGATPWVSAQDFAQSLPPPFPPTSVQQQSSYNTLQSYDSGAPQHRNTLPPTQQNPFISPTEEDEAADAISPMAAKSVDRIKSFPMVHYPSWSEVSDFDFAPDGAGGRKSVPEGWHPWRERRDGRYELA